MQMMDNEQASLINEKKLSSDVGYSCMHDGIRTRELHTHDSDAFPSALENEK